jgi:hypothetical protein
VGAGVGKRWEKKVETCPTRRIKIRAQQQKKPCILFSTIFDTSNNGKGLQIDNPYVKIGITGNDKKITIIAKPLKHGG